MSNTKGFGSDERVGAKQRFNTVQPIGSRKAAMDMLPKALAPLSALEINAEVNPDPLTEKRIVIITGHSLREGDVIRWVVGNNSNVESTVDEVIDANSVKLAGSLDFAPIITDTYIPMRHLTLTLDVSGNLVTSSGPLQFVKDAVSTEVIEDTVTPANNIPLPMGPFIYKDGEQVPVTKDTVTPSNTVGMPVEIVGADGAVINITAGDINVQTSHLGANADSMRIGDGVNELAVNANLEALVHDTDALAQLTAIAGLDFSTETTLAAVLAKIIAAPATEAKQDATISELQAILSKIIMAPATESRQDDIYSELQAILSKLISAPATEAKQDDTIVAIEDVRDKLIVAPATEFKQDAVITELGNILAAVNSQSLTPVDVISPIDVSVSNIPASAANPLEIIASTSGTIKKIKTIEDVGEYIGLYTGLATVETLVSILPIAGGDIDITIPAGTRLSIRHMKNTNIATNTLFAANLLG